MRLIVFLEIKSTQSVHFLFFCLAFVSSYCTVVQFYMSDDVQVFAARKNVDSRHEKTHEKSTDQKQ